MTFRRGRRHVPAGGRAISPTRTHVTAEWPLDRLMARADALAGAWGARARASTTIGQERAILRLFGVTGLDAAGRPLAGATVDRWLTSDPRAPRQRHRASVRDGVARVRPRATAAGDGCRLGCDRPHPRGRTAPRARPARRRRGRGAAARDGGDRAHRRPAHGQARDRRDARRGRPPMARGHPARARGRGRPRGGRQPDRGRHRPDPDRGPDRTRAGRPFDQRGRRGPAVAAARDWWHGRA